jgi:hypothetical protein
VPAATVLRDAGIRAVTPAEPPVPAQLAAPLSAGYSSQARPHAGDSAPKPRAGLAPAAVPSAGDGTRERWADLAHRLLAVHPPGPAADASPADHRPARLPATAPPPGPDPGTADVPTTPPEVVIERLDVRVVAPPGGETQELAVAPGGTRGGAWEPAARRYLGRVGLS